MSNTDNENSMIVKLTKLELEAIIGAAGQMNDDFENYYSFMPKNKLDKFSKAFDTGMNKLKVAFSHKRVLSDKEVQDQTQKTVDYISGKLKEMNTKHT